MPALILALLKAVPALETAFAQGLALFAAWKREQNATRENTEADRDNAAVDAAVSRLPKLCAGCPFASDGGGQHGAADRPAGLSAGGGGGA